MTIVESLSAVSFSPLLAADDPGRMLDFWMGQRSRLGAALNQAAEQAWKAVEVALAGPAWWERCKVLLEPGEDTALGERIQAYLDSVAGAGLPTDEDRRLQCLQELRAARRAGLLHQPFVPTEDFRQTLTAAADDLDRGAMDQIAAELRKGGCNALADLVVTRSDGGAPLLAAAARYFLRRELHADADLARQLNEAGLTLPASAPTARFDALAEVLAHYGRRLEVLLATAVAAAAESPVGYPLDLEREARGQGDAVQQIAQGVGQLLADYHLRQRELRLADVLSLRSEADRQRLRELVGRFHALDPEQQRRLPALLNGLAMLEAAAGDFEAAQRDFQAATTVATDPHALACLHFNASQVALESHDWAEALTLLERAATLWPERFAPFPFSKYEAERILGVGASGVSFLCRHRPTDGRVVIKALGSSVLRRDVADLFREAHTLEGLDHPGIVRLRDCDFADAARSLPFMVTEYFEGLSLAEHVQQHGPLSADDWLRVARPLVEAVQLAHERNILHRDIKPANVLVRQDGGEWRVKLIDFGLALKPIVLHGTLTNTAVASRSAVGKSAAGTIPYTSPEEIGWVEGVPVGPHSDVYSFGKTCYFALLGTPEPDDEEKATLPAAWKRLLGVCTARSVARRLPHFKAVLDRLGQMQATAAPPAPPEPKTEAAQPAPSPGLSKPDAERVMAHINRGTAYRQHGDFDKAIAHFTRALQIDPKISAVYIKRGNVHSDRGDFDRAIVDYTAALRVDPKNALAYVNRGLAHAKKGEFDAVIADCSAAIGLDPKLASAYFIRGAAYSSRGEKHRAIAEFNLAIRLDPKNPLAYNDRGLAFSDQGEHDRAIADFTAALRLDPRLTLAYVNRGIAFRNKGNHDRAVAEFTKALRLEPRNVPAWFNRGLAFQARGSHEQAVGDFDKVLQLDPRHPEAAARREEARKARGTARPAGRPGARPAPRPEEERASSRTTRTEDERGASRPTRADEAKNSQEEERRQVRAAAYFARGRAFFEQGEYNQALEQFTKAIQMDPKDALAYYNRGLAYVAQTEYQEAIADYTSALHLNPRNAMAYYHRGIAHRLLGEHDRAIADYTRALRLDPRLAVAYRNRAQAHAAKGDSEKAQADYAEAVRLDPSLARK